MAESDFILDFSEKVDVPPECKNCPTLGRLAVHHDMAAVRANRIAGIVMSGRVEQSIMNDMLQNGVPEQEVAQYLADHKGSIRDYHSALVDGLYKELDQIVEGAENTIKECHTEGTPEGEHTGSLKMRARRAGKQVTVTLCMSELLARYTAQTPMSTELVVVERTPITD